jgi:hypothetical protein
MKTLLRRTISFTSTQMESLKIRANELEISVADLVRRIVDEWRKNG